jgi:hypothetical protein
MASLCANDPISAYVSADPVARPGLAAVGSPQANRTRRSFERIGLRQDYKRAALDDGRAVISFDYTRQYSDLPTPRPKLRIVLRSRGR